MLHARHVAVSVVGVRFNCAAHLSLAQSVVVQRRLDQAWLVVGVCASPIAVLSLMDQSQEVANAIVLISLGITAHRLPVVRVRQVHAELVVPTRLRMRYLPDMFAPRSFDQTIDRVVGIFRVRLDYLVVEVYRPLGIVADRCDVARRVVGVGKVL
jgi:hypothetical protein